MRRWIYRPGQPPEEVTADWTPTARVQINADSHYEGIRATDGTVLDSRRKHREYLKEKGLTLASDYRETWARAESERAKFRAGDFDRKERREAIARALYERHRP